MSPHTTYFGNIHYKPGIFQKFLAPNPTSLFVEIPKKFPNKTCSAHSVDYKYVIDLSV